VRIFAHWASAGFGQLWENYRRSTNFFPRNKFCISFDKKMVFSQTRLLALPQKPDHRREKDIK
jgi:hypothetical protein